jgi:hypothetical protein
MARIRSPRLLVACALLLAGVPASAVIATPAAAVTGLTLVVAQSVDTGSESFKWAQAVCPSDTHVLGGGVDINGGTNRVHVSSTLPLAGPPDSWWVTAMLDVNGEYSQSWSITAFAICAPEISGWEIVQADASAAAGSVYTETAVTCPAGKSVIGTGGAASGGSRYILNGVEPYNDLTGTYVEVIGDQTTPIPDSAWGAHAYAVCVDPLPGQQLVEGRAGWTTDDKTASVDCPSGTRVHGTGAGLTGAWGQAHFDRIGLHGTGTLGGVDIDARQDLDGTSLNWSMYVYAICAT